MKNEGDMAYELAEYEFLHAPIQELMDMVGTSDVDEAMNEGWKEILGSYTSMSVEEIHTRYTQLVKE